jgi:hypothetical protein
VDGSINLPATFQFSPATSKSIDIPDAAPLSSPKMKNGMNI